MADQCSEIERIAKIEVENKTSIELLGDIKKNLVWFWATFAIAMLGIVVSIIVASFNLGAYTKTLEDAVKDIAVVQEKVSSLEDVVFTHGIYERKD